MTVRKVYYNHNNRTKAARCDISESMPDVAIVYGTKRNGSTSIDPPALLMTASSKRTFDDPTENDDAAATSSTISACMSSPIAPRRVSFGNVQIIEDSASHYDTSFWWSKMDMISTRKADRNSCYTNHEVKKYLYYFEKFYRSLDDDSSESLTPQESNLFATGLREGFQGVERESPFEQCRQNERKQIVAAVVAAYKSLDEQDDDEEMLRTFSSSLTRKMAHWAICVAQAAHLAAEDKLEP
jgi:hypothetical protein